MEMSLEDSEWFLSVGGAQCSRTGCCSDFHLLVKNNISTKRVTNMIFHVLVL